MSEKPKKYTYKDPKKTEAFLNLLGKHIIEHLNRPNKEEETPTEKGPEEKEKTS